MARRGRQTRKRARLLTVWALLALVAAAAWSRRFCDNQGASLCADFGNWSLEARSPVFLAIIALVVLVPAAAIWIRRRRQLAEPGFKNQPWLFDREVLELTGRIEHVLADSMGERLKRRVTDAYRNATGNEDWRNRYIHQRFLLSSPLLRRGNNLLVLHNTKYGSLPLKAGAWVRVRGEYLHGDSAKNSIFKERHFYGQLHFTHEPRGFLEVLESRPDSHEMRSAGPARAEGGREVHRDD